MKILKTFLFTFIIISGHLSVGYGASLYKSSQWPFSDPTLFLKGGVNAVTTGSDLVFWAIGDTVLVIDKETFTPISKFQVATSTTIQDILYDEASSKLYIAAGYDENADSGGLQIFDLTDPSNPSSPVIFDKAPDNPGSIYLTERTDVPDIDARGVGLYNGNLFLADFNFGLRVIDITAEPVEVPLDENETTEERISGYKQPNIIGSYDTTGGYVNLIVYPFNDKIYAFVLDFFHGVKVFDVTDPTVIDDPVLKDTRTNVWYGSVSLLSDFFVTETGGHLTTYVTGTNAVSDKSVISRLDVSFNESLPITNFGRYETENETRSVCVSGNYAYLADGASGLEIVNISDVPVSGEVLTYSLAGSYATNVDYSYNVWVDSTTLYLASGESGLTRFNLNTDPTVPSPMVPFKLDSPVMGDDVFVQGDYTYVLDRNTGLRIFNTSNPDYLILNSFLELDGPSTDLCVSGNYAYISKSSGSITVVDITTADTPSIKPSVITTPDPKGLAISENTLYIADGTSGSGLYRVDITDPLNPVALGSTPTIGSAQSVHIYENRAYVAEGASGLEIFYVSDSSNPVQLVSTSMHDAKDVSTLEIDNIIYALIADGDEGLKILNVNDLTEPLPPATVVNQMDTDTTPSSFSAVSVSALNNVAYVGLGYSGLLILNLSDPTVPTEIYHQDSSSYTRDIVPYTIDSTTYISVAEGGVGFVLYYLFESDVDPSKPLVPTIDSGCFIKTSLNQESNIHWSKKLILRLLSLLSCNTFIGETS